MGRGTYRRLREGRESASEMIDLKGDGVEGAGLGVAPGHSLGPAAKSGIANGLQINVSQVHGAPENTIRSVNDKLKMA